MKTYEFTYIISPEITFEEAESKGKKLESAIQEREGIILKQINPIAKTLAFPISKRASGFFGVIEFQLEPEKLLELKDIVTKDKEIVRQMIVIKERVKPKKERGTKKQKTPIEQDTEAPITQEKLEEKHEKIKTDDLKAKVELKDIEQQLDELLGQ
jgi:ribosomal protein S6